LRLIGRPAPGGQQQGVFDAYFRPRRHLPALRPPAVDIAGVAAWCSTSVSCSGWRLHDLNHERYAPWLYGHFYWWEQITGCFLLRWRRCSPRPSCCGCGGTESLSSDALTGLFNRAYF